MSKWQREIEEQRRLPPLFRGKNWVDFVSTSNATVLEDQVKNLTALNKQQYTEGFDAGEARGIDKGWDEAAELNYTEGYNKGFYKSARALVDDGEFLLVEHKNGRAKITQKKDLNELTKWMKESGEEKYKPFILKKGVSHEKDIYIRRPFFMKNETGDIMYVDLGKVKDPRFDGTPITGRVVKWDASKNKYITDKHKILDKNSLFNQIVPPPSTKTHKKPQRVKPSTKVLTATSAPVPVPDPMDYFDSEPRVVSVPNTPNSTPIKIPKDNTIQNSSVGVSPKPEVKKAAPKPEVKKAPPKPDLPEAVLDALNSPPVPRKKATPAPGTPIPPAPGRKPLSSYLSQPALEKAPRSTSAKPQPSKKTTKK